MNKILITGGCGYIGSHITLDIVEYIKECNRIILLDNFSNSRMNYKLMDIIGDQCEIIIINDDISLQENQLNHIFQKYKINIVLHLASYKSVPESVYNPIKYYHNNIIGFINLIKSMEMNNIYNLIISSTASIYGDNDIGIFDENNKINCTNPYAKSKYMIEEICKDLVNISSYWNIIILRYFNPVGCHKSYLVGESPKNNLNNLFPTISKNISENLKIKIYGDQYNTPDGTCIRDYIHIEDLSQAHILAIQNINNKSIYDENPLILNVGSNKGYSVLEVINMFSKILNKNINYIISDKRIGDVEKSICDNSKIKKLLHWKITKNLEDMVKDECIWRGLIKQ